MDGLASLVKSWARRAKLQRSVWWLFFGLASGLALALILAIAARVWPLMTLPSLITSCIVLAVLGLFIALMWPWVQSLRTPLLTWSRVFDQQFGLRQRVSTAMEASDGTLSVKSDAIRMRLQQDASRIADSVDARKLLPLRLSWRAAVTSLVLLMALALALVLPNAQQQALAVQEQFQQSLQQQVQQIEQAKQQILQSKALTDAQKQEALQALDEANQALSDPNTTPEKALAAINDAQSKLDAMRDQEAQQRNADLEGAGESLAADELTNALANSLANQNFEEAAQQMRNMATQPGAQQNQSLSLEETQRVADQLDQLARQVQTSDPAMAEKLREAAQQMRDGNTEAAQQSLDEAAQSLDRARQTQQANQSLQEAQAQTEAARQSVAQANQQMQQQSQSSEQAQANTNNQNNQNGQNQANQNQANQTSQNQGGQPEAGAQQANGQQAGQAEGAGEAGQPGSSGQAGAPGDAQSGAPGEGASGSTSQGSVAQGSSQQSGHSEDTGSENSVYAPGRVKNQGEQVVLEDPQGEIVPDPNSPKNTAPEGQSTVPYQDVYGEYAKSADDAIQNDEVPPGLRDYVRDYFSSLDPKRTR